MAERAASKARKSAQKAPSQPAKGRAKAPVVRQAPVAQEASAGLEAEVVRLRQELEEARARIRTLEAQREATANRIDWVIDSLHSLLDE